MGQGPGPAHRETKVLHNRGLEEASGEVATKTVTTGQANDYRVVHYFMMLDNIIYSCILALYDNR